MCYTIAYYGSRDSKSTQNIFFQKTLSLFCDHCFDLELPLSILKHNLVRLIYTRNQIMEEMDPNIIKVLNDKNMI